MISVVFSGIVWWGDKSHSYTEIRASDNVVHLQVGKYISPNGLSDKIMQWNANHSLPGVFNLIEDAAKFLGALSRPIKECSLG